MKHLLTLGLFLFLTLKMLAQTDGISYQAIIIGPDALELPGVDSEGNYLPTTDVAIKFSIIAPGSGVVEFTEIQNTTTDEFGRINLIIGSENYDDFEKIDWNGNPKSLKVEIDFNNGDGFVDMSVEILTYVPYVAHRDITATGTLEVDDNTTLRGELTVVDKPTNLGGTLNVNGGNRSNLSGDLNVDGETNLNNTLNVTGQSVSNLSGALNVGDPLVGPPDGDPNAPTTLNGSLTVVGESTFTGLVAEDLIINNSTELNGSVAINSDEQIIITSTLNGSDLDITKYPVKIEGGNQGLAILVDGDRTNDNNFVSFWDTSVVSNPTISGVTLVENSPNMWGRIEGERPSEFDNNADYLFDQASLAYDVFDADVDLAWATIDIVIEGFDLAAAYTDFRPCLGFGACTTSPGFADIAASVASVVLVLTKEGFAIAGKIRADNNRNQYDDDKFKFQGVTYASGAGDYAEYLLRENINEKITFGDIVGVKGGKVSKNIQGAERLMVVSLKPIVLGNMPQPNKEDDYEKVAFMGQVPVKVFGKVTIGDYILPSGKNDGIGIAVNPSNMSLKDIKNIVGIAWSESNNSMGFNMVNVAVGLNRNDNNPIIEELEKKVLKQSEEISNLKNQVAQILEKFSELEQGISPSTNQYSKTQDNHDDRKHEIFDSPEGEIIYFEMKNEDFEHGLQIAQEQLLSEGVNFENDALWKRINNDPLFKDKLREKLQTKFHKQIHYHKEVSKKSRD